MTPAATVGLHHVEDVMGMAVSIDVRDIVAAPSAIAEVVAWLHHVDDTYSTYKPESPISAIGHGELSLPDVSDQIHHVLSACERLRVETGGAFDAFAVPAPNGTSFDPSGYVKGWSVEQAASILEAHGCHNFCVNAGGDIALRGEPGKGRPWRVGIRHPSDPMAVALVLEGRGPLAVATSATYERGAHIVDPGTGCATTEVASVTVVGQDLGHVDGLATAVFVMGVDGLDWLGANTDAEGYVILHDGTTRWTDGFGQYRSS